jgi:hypothetical protein
LQRIAMRADKPTGAATTATSIQEHTQQTGTHEDALHRA